MKTPRRCRFLPFLALVAAAGLAGVSTAAQAGVFSTPHFIPAGEFSLGVEPELILTNGAGIGVNARYTHGINDLSNVTAILGTGSGPRRFRVGANVTFDFFPDIEGQPGIGIAVQTLYYRLPNAGQLEVTLIPYVHKTFLSGKDEIEPYLAIPFGSAFSEGNYKTITNVAVGSLFKNSEHLRYVIEFGINVNRSETYISGGVVYYH